MSKNNYLSRIAKPRRVGIGRPLAIAVGFLKAFG